MEIIIGSIEEYKLEISRDIIFETISMGEF